MSESFENLDAALDGGFDVTHDERLAFASTLASEWYTDASVARAETERVFGRTWQLAGRAEQVASPGQYFTTEVGGEQVLVVRGADARLRALSNVCRHRAGPVASGAGGARKSFQCGYHGWTYALDGRLQGTPEFEGVECWRREEHSLPEFRAEVWGALVFVNLDAECAPLIETLEDLPERMRACDWEGMRQAARKEWVLECNWKVYVDNYLEGYHIPIVHPSLNRELDYAAYRTETKRLYSIQHAPIKRAATRLATGDDGEANEAQFFWIFPNLMLNVYPDNYSTNLIVPLGAERTLTIFEWYMRDPETQAAQEQLERIIAFSDEIQLEDIRICEAVQRGLRSRNYTRGRYSVRRENGVHHFHGLLAEFLSRR